MRFRIKRASTGCREDKSPYKGAVWVEGVRERQKYGRGGEILGTVEVPDNRWEIDVNTLDELVEISAECEIILSPDSIVIYDDYME